MATLLEMTLKETQRKLAVMQAYVAGQTICTKVKLSGSSAPWQVVKYPIWDWYSFDYKVQDEA